MVLEAFNLLVFAARMLFSFLNIPLGPFMESATGELVYFALIAVVLASAHLLELRYSLMLSLLTMMLGLVLGNAYLGVLTVTVLFPWVFVIRWFTGAPDYEEEIETKLPKQEAVYTPPQQEIGPMQFAPGQFKPKKVEPRNTLTEKYSFFKNEESSKIYPSPKINQLCPTCATPLKYLSENKKYYCPTCVSYVSLEKHD
jgi:hypothetical protein